jgi:hypothetical protein
VQRDGLVAIPMHFWLIGKCNQKIVSQKLFFRIRGVIRITNNIPNVIWEELDFMERVDGG